MITKTKKQQVITELTDLMKQAQAVYFTSLAGLTVSQLNDLRKNLREVNAKAKVAKKTLIDFSFRQVGQEVNLKDKFTDSVLLEFAQGDILAAAKIIWQFSKTNDKCKILGGVVEGKLLTGEEVIQLAKIPSREVLLGRLVSSLASPIRNFEYLLKANTIKLVTALSAIQK
ncbi:MAG: large subunit ribosomal protein [Patescibacteria group bacterium]|nr:large subunit ribosomal protein [Patescibacteria group bacterium]